MNDKIYVSFANLGSEKFFRNLFLFLFIFLMTLAQGWENILLFLFPLISFSFSMFFIILATNKWRTEFENRTINYQPLGAENKNADRLFFCALFQLFLLFWYGAESLYHPQLVDDYYMFFKIFLVFMYTYGFFWIFLDLWKNCRIDLILYGVKFNYTSEQSNNLRKNIEGVLNNLKLSTYRLISIISLLTFIIINILNSLDFLLNISIDLFPSFQYNLPGTGIEDSQPISFSIIFYTFLIVPPIITIILLIMTYNTINSINKRKIEKILSPLPKNIQKTILENLKLLNKRLMEEFRSD
ncbi:MAG: hypothetical protein ACTSPW_10465 [Promethearchaeota archaeon]